GGRRWRWDSRRRGSAGYPAGDGGEPLLPRLPHHEALPVLLRRERGRVGHLGTPLPNVVGRPGVCGASSEAQRRCPERRTLQETSLGRGHRGARQPTRQDSSPVAGTLRPVRSADLGLRDGLQERAR
ncbi:unnamed protein product, partial [Ectocarpus sp. 12 AP-2014]